MKKFVATALPAFSLACLILFLTIWQSSAIEYKFSPTPNPNQITNNATLSTTYKLPQIGSIGAESPFWPIKALGQKINLIFSGNYLVAAQKALDYADERLVNAQNLFKNNKTEEAVSVLVKAEMYLNIASQNEKSARAAGVNSKEFLQKLAEASIAHKQVIDSIVNSCNSDARAFVVKTGDYPKSLYIQTKSDLVAYGVHLTEDIYY